ncbi:MAG: acetate--CoA ligase [Dehalococcoidia bacterium]|nr:acetate--CoA ligase [Dehalococcoidia bacterium]|tara:strand:- start:429 stop:2384 length:1956 start_codon:yes stop_codon:yes gene_type:complete
MTDLNADIESLLTENRSFLPPPEFVRQANVNDPLIYEQADANFEEYWSNWATQLDWFKKWNETLDWNPPFAKWFINGKLNVSYNCLDRHLQSGRRNKAALIWEGEPGDWKVYTFGDLHREVCRFANGLKSLGVKKGDRITMYMPMIPELTIAMLACARIGAPHSIVFGGFSSESLRDRINDCGSKILITADGGYRRGQIIPLKKNSDEALEATPSIEKSIVVKRIGEKAKVQMKPDRDIWWDDLVRDAPYTFEAEHMDSEDMLFVLYTSGTTGKPKGVVHTTGGYLTGVYATTKWVFDLKDDDVYWCTADIGWITGHSYIVYGPLANGATTVMYEGSPDFPDKDRFWDIIEKYRCTILYTAPTAIRACMRWGEEYPAKHDLSSLRLLGTVGEPINPEAWIWYHTNIGGSRCPIVDTWWQTETGSILITPLAGLTTTIPGSATKPFPGIRAEVWDANGNPVSPGNGGYLVLTRPWPSMIRTIYGDNERFKEQYWTKYPNTYFTGDGAKIDENGYIWVLGRVDDVINVAGHRISTMEVESALVDHSSVAEAASIGRSDSLKGQAVVSFVILKDAISSSKILEDELKAHVTKKIGAIARPDKIFFTADLPKTRSGKIMRRLLRDIAEGHVLGDTTTLADASAIELLKDQYEDAE